MVLQFKLINGGPMNGCEQRTGEFKWKKKEQIQKEGIAFANSRINQYCIKDHCPCKIWTNCHKYNTKIWKSLHPDKFNIEIHNWYDIHFHINYQYPDTFGNG